jgi:hypothetical protein
VIVRVHGVAKTSRIVSNQLIPIELNINGLLKEVSEITTADTRGVQNGVLRGIPC